MTKQRTASSKRATEHKRAALDQRAAPTLTAHEVLRHALRTVPCCDPDLHHGAEPAHVYAASCNACTDRVLVEVVFTARYLTALDMLKIDGVTGFKLDDAGRPQPYGVNVHIAENGALSTPSLMRDLTFAAAPALIHALFSRKAKP